MFKWFWTLFSLVAPDGCEKSWVNGLPIVIYSFLTVHLQQLRGMQSSNQGMWKGSLALPTEGIRRGTFSVKNGIYKTRVRKYAKFGVFYAKIAQMTPLRLRMESLWLQKFLVTNREPLRLKKFSVTNTVLSLPFSQKIQFTLNVINVANLN